MRIIYEVDVPKGREMVTEHNLRKMIGQPFGNLRVIKKVTSSTKDGRYRIWVETT